MNLDQVPWIRWIQLGGGYSSMIWVGTCCWHLKVDPFWYQILLKSETHFYTRATNFKQNLLKKFTLVSKIVKLSCNEEIGPIFCANFRKFWKYDPCLYQFLHWIKGHRYTRRLILWPISAAHPQIDFCTKTPTRFNCTGLFRHTARRLGQDPSRCLACAHVFTHFDDKYHYNKISPLRFIFQFGKDFISKIKTEIQEGYYTVIGLESKPF